MKFDEWLKNQLEGEGLKGIVIYNEIEDSYNLKLKNMDIGLCEPLWQDYDNKEVIIKIHKVSKEDKTLRK